MIEALKNVKTLTAYLVLFLSLITPSIHLLAQTSGNCAGAQCLGASTSYSAPVGTGTAPAGNNYGCLGGQPNPSFFYVQATATGTININQTASPAIDQDYAVWGPFTSLSTACAGLTTAPISCSFSTAANNSFTINATAGSFYVILFTNWAGGSTTNSIAISGTSGVSCAPFCTVTANNTGPYCAGATIVLTAGNATGSNVGSPTTYTWTGPNGYTATGQNVSIPASTAANAGVYTVTATGVATCTASTTVVVNPTPTLNPTSNSPLCAGSPLVMNSGATGGIVAWTGPPGSGWAFLGTGANLNPQPLPNPTPGTYNITVLQNGCTTTGSIVVTVGTPPTATISGSYTVCAGVSIPDLTFTGTPANTTFNWVNNQPSIGLPASGTGNIPSFATTNNGSTAINATITVTPVNGSCIGTPGTISVTVNPGPVITNIPSSNVYCNGSTVPQVNWVTSSPATVDWTCDNPAVGVAGSGTSAVPSFTATNTSTTPLVATFSGTPTNGSCTGPAVTYTVTAVAMSDATITDISSLCDNGSPVTLTAADAGGTWSGNGITDAVAGVFDPVVAGSGPANVTYTIPGQCGSSDNTFFQVISTPQANAGADFTICQGASQAFAGSFTNSTTGTETITWSPATDLSLASSLTPNFTADITSDYTLTVANGMCSSSDLLQVNIIPVPDATIASVSPVCEDMPAFNLSAASPGGIWSGTGVTPTGNFDPSIGPNTYTITYQIPGTCVSSDSQDIIVWDVVDGTITPAGPFCQYDLPVTMTAATPGGTWSGTPITNASTGAFGPATLPGNTYTITYTTPGNCPRNSTENVIVYTNGDATITPVSAVCNDVPAFSLTTADAGGTWSGSASASGTFDPTSLIPGSYWVRYDVTGNCPDTDSLQITVNEVFDGTITPAGPFCQVDLPQTLTAASTGGAWTGTGIVSSSLGTFGSSTLAEALYTVTYTTAGACPRVFTENIQVYANLNPTITNAGPFCEDAANFNLIAASPGGVWTGDPITAGGQISPSNLGPGTYVFNYDINNNGCTTHDDVQVLVNGLPVPNFTSNVNAGCSPLSVSLTNTSTPAGTSCVWVIDGSNEGSGNNFTYSFEGNHCFDVGIVITDGNGCTNTLTQNDMICTVLNPSASFEWSPSLPMAATQVDFNNLSVGGLQFNWTINGENFTAEDVTYLIPAEASGNFQACLEVTGTGGCTDYQCYTITLDEQQFIYIPNSFTPDNDGTNDVFLPIITGMDDGQPYSFQVFNRWGDVVFETSNPNEPWIGNVRGGNHYAEPDAYTYLLKVQLSKLEPSIERRGTIILVR